MNWISDFLSHGGAKLFFFAVILLFHFAKSWSKKAPTTSHSASNTAKQELNDWMNSAPDSRPTPRSAPLPKAEVQVPLSNASRSDISPWSDNQNPFDSLTKPNS